jgi:hypothetical protein
VEEIVAAEAEVEKVAVAGVAEVEVAEVEVAEVEEDRFQLNVV